jgi:demethylmenaquinone methyltransferase/2-methoxy-6-polyprenyl-1,4-benzoquinol methylase
MRGLKKKVFFNQIAEDWDKEHQGKEELERTRLLVEHYNLMSGEKVLDIGCGTGRLIPFIEDKIGHQGILMELDFSEEMLKVGKTKYQYKNLFFIKADAHQTGFTNHYFNTIICLAIFPHLNDKPGALREFRRILKPGGQLIISHQMSREEINQFHKNVKGPVTRDLLPDDKEMEQLFTQAGYRSFFLKNEPGFYLARAKS